MREQREYRYALVGTDCTRRREAGCVDGTDNDDDASNDDQNTMNKEKDKNEDRDNYRDKERDKDKNKYRNRDRNMDKSKWLTSKGFQYPALKTKKEEMTHPKRPPDSTIENLRKPWYKKLPSFLPSFLFLIAYCLSSFISFCFFFLLTVLFFVPYFFLTLSSIPILLLLYLFFSSPSPSPYSSPYSSPCFYYHSTSLHHIPSHTLTLLFIVTPRQGEDLILTRSATGPLESSEDRSKILLLENSYATRVRGTVMHTE